MESWRWQSGIMAAGVVELRHGDSGEDISHATLASGLVFLFGLSPPDHFSLLLADTIIGNSIRN